MQTKIIKIYQCNIHDLHLFNLNIFTTLNCKNVFSHSVVKQEILKDLNYVFNKAECVYVHAHT